MGYDMNYRDGKSTDLGEEGYFRLNMSGMYWARQEMQERKMIFWADEPSWPEYPGEWIRKLKYPGEYPDVVLTPEQEREGKAYIAACEATREWHGPEVPGIPGHKLCSNDGWVVLPAECEAAVRLARESGPPEQYADVWERWIAFMERSRRHGGFEVW